MALTSSNQRIAIQSLLNDTGREVSRGSSKSHTKGYECDQCHKRYVLSGMEMREFSSVVVVTNGIMHADSRSVRM